MTCLRFLAAAIGFLAGCAVAAAEGEILDAKGGEAIRPAAIVAQATVTPVDEMNPEMRRAYIVGIQEELADHGYRPGPADGVMGSRTAAAIREYQADAGLAVTGIASKELLDHLKFVLPKVYANGAQPPSEASKVYLGLVEEVQIELQKRGYYEGVIDGIEGSRTRAAVAAFQTDAGHPVSGRADATALRQLIVTDPAVRAAN
jgi:peptidoglycan hydrolase-like protein with peptidoglycan-binding domain